MIESAVLWHFLAIFSLLIAAGVGLSPPEEAVVMGAALWVGASPDLGWSRWLVLPICILGIVISDVILYVLGRFGGRWLFRSRWLSRFFSCDRLAQVEKKFHHHGINILLLVRWIPGIRTPLFITAGMMRLSFPRFVLFDTLAALLGHCVLFFLAYKFTNTFIDLYHRVENNLTRPVLILLGSIVIGLFLLFHFLRPSRTPKDIPQGLALPEKQEDDSRDCLEEKSPPALQIGDSRILRTSSQVHQETVS